MARNAQPTRPVWPLIARACLVVAALVVARPGLSQSNGAPVLEAHQVPAEQREAVDQWRRGLPVEVRTVWDDRTGRLLLLAPLETHAELLRMLAGTPSAPMTPPAAQPGRFGAPPSPTRLRRLSPEELHGRLEALARQPLPATWDAQRTALSFPAMLGDGPGVRFRVDARSGEVAIDGPADAVRAWRGVVSAMEESLATDGGDGPGRSTVRIVSTRDAQPAKVRGALRAIQAATPVAEANGGASERVEADGAILGPVQIEFVDGLDVIVLRGDQQDVDRVMAIIDQIEQLSSETTPEVRVRRLQHIDSDSLARLLAGIYEQVLGPRVGDLSVTGLAKPNAVLLAGRPENVQIALGLIDQLDQPVEPTARFEAYPLRHASAEDVKTLIDDYFAQQAATDGDEGASLLRSRAFVVADYRSNVVIVSAAPRDQAEVRSLVDQIDAARGEAVDEVRVFPLRNALAEDLAEVIQEAIAPAEGDGDEGASPRAAALRLGAGGGDPGQFESGQFESGVLTGVRVSPDTRANALVVTAPADSMELIAALVERLDRSPDAQAELKVFTVANGDAVELAAMLRSLFGTEDDDEEAGGYGANDLSPLNVSVDERTNSILAAGSAEDLAVVEAILLRLDDAEVRRRQTNVYRLRNADAQEVADVLNQWLETEREAEEDAELVISPREQVDREVVVVAEPATNSLIVSATPRYELELRTLVEQLDERPPMVMIQVMIAEVALNDTDEFGVELGLQDSLLFDRSLLSDTEFITTTTNEQSPGGATITTETQQIISSDLTPGFNFNNQDLGNNGSTTALGTAGNVAAQALSNFALGRVNGDLNFGGFVFSASSSNLSVLLRALQETRRLEVLSRPQIMTLDRNTGTVQVGARVPRITSVNNNQFGQSNSIVYENVGIILEVTPRISPDGQVVMQVLAEKSEVGEEEDGIPINIAANGDVIRAPQIETTQATTTVSAASGQTVVLSGLLTKRTFDVHRRVPLLANVPLLGDLFRYDGVEETRTELLIIMTPRVISSEIDAEMLKQVESSRMSWVLGDVVDMHGPAGLRTRGDSWEDAEACFPTHVPVDAELPPGFGVEGEVAPLPQAGQPGPELGDSAGVEPVSYAAPPAAQPAPRRLPTPGW